MTYPFKKRNVVHVGAEGIIAIIAGCMKQIVVSTYTLAVGLIDGRTWQDNVELVESHSFP